MAPVEEVAAPATVAGSSPRRKATAKRAPAAKKTPATVEDADDDFRRIQGVGPKMAAALHGAGIRTFRLLADLDQAALRETIRGAGLRATASVATWPQQAKILAAQTDGDA